MSTKFTAEQIDQLTTLFEFHDKKITSIVFTYIDKKLEKLWQDINKKLEKLEREIDRKTDEKIDTLARMIQNCFKEQEEYFTGRFNGIESIVENHSHRIGLLEGRVTVVENKTRHL